MFLAYLQGGPADLQKHAIDVDKPPEQLLIGYMEPVSRVAVRSEQLAPVKKLRYVVIGGWEKNITYAFKEIIQEIIQ